MANGAPGPWWWSNVQDVYDIDIIDPLTVKVWMKGLSAFYLRNIGFTSLMPKHIWNDPNSNAYIGMKAGETQENYVARIMGIAPDRHLIGPGAFKVYPNRVRALVAGETPIPGGDAMVYTPTVSVAIEAYKPFLGQAAGPNEDMTDPVTGEYIGYFRSQPISVVDPIQNIRHTPTPGNSYTEEYIYLENSALSDQTVSVTVILVGTGPIRTISGIKVPAATPGGITGKYFISKTNLYNNMTGTIRVLVTPGVPWITVYAQGSINVAETSIYGDVISTADVPGDHVNVYDATRLSPRFWILPLADTGKTGVTYIRGPWGEPNADFNDDNFVDVQDAVMLSSVMRLN